MTDTPPPGPTPEEIRRAWAAAKQSDIYFLVQEELEKMRDNQRMLILVTHGFIELIINALVDTYCKNAKKISGNNRDFSHSAKLVILHEKDVLSDHSFKLLNWFRKVRNDAAHEAIFRLTAQDLHLFVSPLYRDPSNFWAVCDQVLTILMMLYMPVLFERLMPTLHAGLPPQFAFEEREMGDVSSLLLELVDSPSTTFKAPRLPKKA